MTSYNEFAKKINKEIKCPNLRELLFGMPDVEAEDLKGIGTINRMLTFGFMVAFTKWKNCIIDGNKIHLSPNSRRVFDAFKSVYNGENIELDLIIYTMTEMQLDEYGIGKQSYFSDIISGAEDTVQIPALRNLIKTWFQSVKRAEKNQEILLGKLVGLYNAFPFLKNSKVSFVKHEELPFELIEIELRQGKVLKPYMIMARNEFGNFYLQSYSILQDNLSRLTYSTFDGVELYQEVILTKIFSREAAIRNQNQAPRNIMAKSLFSLSFKYIKNLSLALSDTVKRQTMQKLYEHFSQKYSDVFELGFKKPDELNWDNIITILIIEEGPSELLEFILDSDGFYFDMILDNLEKRYHEPGFTQMVKLDYEKTQAQELAVLKSYIDDNSSIIKNISNINKTLMAKGIINGLASLENNHRTSKALFVESLAVRIKNVDKIIMSNDTNRSKTLKINKVLEKTFRYVIPFYYGVIAYQQEKEDLFSEIETKNFALDKVDKNTIFLKCEKKFFEAAESSIKLLNTKSLGELVSEFRTLCNSISTSKGRKVELSPNGRMLKSAIGRDYICAVECFNKVLEIKPDESMDLSDAKIPTDIVSFINNEKHDKGYGTVYANIVLFNKFLIKVKELLYFLIYNEDYQREMMLGQQISFDPIYPYVVCYRTKSENRDGYSVNSFIVFPSEESMSSEIKILSERDYEINEKYYCIPNQTTSNSRWWIEPFLISCRKYDQLVHSCFKKKTPEEEE
ncbi:MAG: hypothetical protein FWE45_00335 [Firmicutes bacterium]|nr:hypothetical protein [Bacillota bacterium]